MQAGASSKSYREESISVWEKSIDVRIMQAKDDKMGLGGINMLRRNMSLANPDYHSYNQIGNGEAPQNNPQ